MKKGIEIVLDFDGTCVTHEFPKVGEDIGAVPVLRELVQNGHRLILFTMRSDRLKGGDTGDQTIMDVTGNFLSDAIDWFRLHELPLYGIQTNPSQRNWTTSPKAYGLLYIDDAALGCPLTGSGLSSRPYVDWVVVRDELRGMGLI